MADLTMVYHKEICPTGIVVETIDGYVVNDGPFKGESLDNLFLKRGCVDNPAKIGVNAVWDHRPDVSAIANEYAAGRLPPRDDPRIMGQIMAQKDEEIAELKKNLELQKALHVDATFDPHKDPDDRSRQFKLGKQKLADHRSHAAKLYTDGLEAGQPREVVPADLDGGDDVVPDRGELIKAVIRAADPDNTDHYDENGKVQISYLESESGFDDITSEERDTLQDQVAAEPDPD